MKFLVVLLVLVGFFGIAYAENPFFDNYEKSQTVLVGKVLSHQQRPNEILYEIQVEDYYKNPQSAKVISVFGSRPEGNNPYMFEIGDRLFLYIDKRDGVHVMQDDSFKLDYSCDASGFIPQTHEFTRGSPVVEFPRFSDADSSGIYKIGKNMQIRYTAYNYNPLVEHATVTLKVSGKYQNSTIFSDQKKVTVPACNGSVPLEWNFTPQKADDYVARIFVISQYDTPRFVANFDLPYVESGFSARENISSKSLDKTAYLIIESPLKQFKSGVSIEKIQCIEGLVLVTKSMDSFPACVKPETKTKLIQRGWIEIELSVDKIDKKVSLGDQTIILSEGIDDLDSGTSFNPIYKKIILDTNNIVTWFNAKQKPVHIQSDESLFDEVILPNESFSYTFDSVGIHRYHDPENWKRGVIFASTSDIELANLRPAKLLEKNQDEIAKTIMRAANKEDEITKVRLNNTIINAYTAKSGADIIVPDSCFGTLSEYCAIEYRYGLTKWFYLQSVDEALDLAKRFMNEIGYNLDGTEWIDSVDYGNYIQVKIQQRIQGWIVSNQIVSFTFFKDNADFSFGRWYDDITGYRFEQSQYDAEAIAKEYMQKEVTNSDLAKFKYAIQETGQAQVIIFDDKPAYVIPVSFKSTLNQKFENSHCGFPEYFTQLVIIDGISGTVLGLDQPGCE